MNKILGRGLLFLITGLGFFAASFQYKLGTLDDPGPSLFPIIVSTALMLIGLVNIVRARDSDEIISGKLKNVFIVVMSIVCFTTVTMMVNMIVGTVILVLVALSAVDDYQFGDVVKLSIGLSLIASFMTYVLGLNLPLWK